MADGFIPFGQFLSMALNERNFIRKSIGHIRYDYLIVETSILLKKRKSFVSTY